MENNLVKRRIKGKKINNPKKNNGPKKEIKQNWKRPKNV